MYVYLGVGESFFQSGRTLSSCPPQVCSLLRCILPVIGPKNLAPMLNILILPPLGYSAIAEAVNSAATINQLGILDCLLAIVAKALSVQVRNGRWCYHGNGC